MAYVIAAKEEDVIKHVVVACVVAGRGVYEAVLLNNLPHDGNTTASVLYRYVKH